MITKFVKGLTLEQERNSSLFRERYTVMLSGRLQDVVDNYEGNWEFAEYINYSETTEVKDTNTNSISNETNTESLDFMTSSRIFVFEDDTFIIALGHHHKESILINIIYETIKYFDADCDLVISQTNDLILNGKKILGQKECALNNDNIIYKFEICMLNLTLDETRAQSIMTPEEFNWKGSGITGIINELPLIDIDLFLNKLETNLINYENFI